MTCRLPEEAFSALPRYRGGLGKLNGGPLDQAILGLVQKDKDGLYTRTGADADAHRALLARTLKDACVHGAPYFSYENVEQTLGANPKGAAPGSRAWQQRQAWEAVLDQAGIPRPS
jgi:hypothetical protein